MKEAEKERRARETRALLAWANTFLKKKKLHADSLTTDFADGVFLINLLEIAFQTTLGKYQLRPRQQFDKMENIAKCFQWLEKNLRIVLLGIDAADLVKKQEKQTIQVLWNVLRGLALKGICQEGEEQSQAGKTMKQNLLAWVEGTGITVTDFWDSFKDGIAFCAIVDNLCPGSGIDVPVLKPENATANLNLAFSTAEAKLGIPPLLQASDLADERKPDEASVMNYVCMLVSVGQGNAKRQQELSALKKKQALEKQAEAAELESVKKALEDKMAKEKAEMEAKKKAMEAEMQSAMDKLMSLKIDADATDEELASTKRAFQEMQQQLRDEQAELLRAFELERAEFRGVVEGLREEKADLASQLDKEWCDRATEKEGMQEQLDDITAQSYAAHREIEDMTDNFRRESTQRAMNKRVVQDEKDAQDSFSQLLKDSINQQKSFKDFINSLPNIEGWLMKKRPDHKISRSSHKRFFTLKGDTLHWGKDNDHPFEKSCVTSKYLMIDRTGMGEENADAEAPKAKSPGHDKRRRSSVLGLKKGQLVMRLIPRDTKKNETLELYPVDFTAKEHSEDIHMWVDTLNTRISLLRYLEGNFNQQALNRGGREIIGFICDPTAVELKIENKVADLHAGLTHFKEPLLHRKGLNFSFTNIAMSDSDVEVLCEIIEANDTVEKVSLQQNLITVVGAKRLALALKKNKSITSLELDFNTLKDEGLTALAEAVYDHRNLQHMSLTSNGIGDVGCLALMTALMDSQKKSDGAPHVWPRLDLANNLIGDPGAKAIARFVRKNPTVEVISLNSNILTDKGIGYILEVATKHKLPIKELLVADNQISSKTAAKLAMFMASIDHELTVDLSFNKLISRKGVMTLLETNVPLEFRHFFLVKKDTEAPDLASPSSGSAAAAPAAVAAPAAAAEASEEPTTEPAAAAEEAAVEVAEVAVRVAEEAKEEAKPDVKVEVQAKEETTPKPKNEEF